MGKTKAKPQHNVRERLYVHGINEIFADGRAWPLKLFWLLCTLCAFAIVVYQVWLLLETTTTLPRTTIETYAESLPTDGLLPYMILCPNNRVNKTRVRLQKTLYDTNTTLSRRNN